MLLWGRMFSNSNQCRSRQSSRNSRKLSFFSSLLIQDLNLSNIVADLKYFPSFLLRIYIKRMGRVGFLSCGWSTRLNEIFDIRDGLLMKFSDCPIDYVLRQVFFDEVWIVLEWFIGRLSSAVDYVRIDIWTVPGDDFIVPSFLTSNISW